MLSVSRHPMRPRLSFPFVDCGPLSRAAMRRGFGTFDALAGFVRDLPYGRVSNAHDCLTVLGEGRGACSAKHRLLAAVAHECGHPEVQLTIGIYEMCEENTPGVGAVLRNAALSSIPEAHRRSAGATKCSSTKESNGETEGTIPQEGHRCLGREIRARCVGCMGDAGSLHCRPRC
jgi:hypothetical protein